MFMTSTYNTQEEPIRAFLVGLDDIEHNIGELQGLVHSLSFEIAESYILLHSNRIPNSFSAPERQKKFMLVCNPSMRIALSLTLKSRQHNNEIGNALHIVLYSIETKLLSAFLEKELKQRKQSCR